MSSFYQISHEHSVERALTVCLNGSIPLNKMAAMPIYGKNALKSCSPKPRKADSWYLVCEVLPKKGKRKVQGVPQSQTAALPRPQEEEETDKSKQAQTEQTYEKH